MTRNAWTFTVCAYGLSWLLAGAFLAVGKDLSDPSAKVFLVTYMFGPAAAALILTRWRGGGEWRKCLGLSFTINPWWVVAWLTPAVIAAMVIVVSIWLPDISLVSFADGVAARRGAALTPEQMAHIKPLAVIVLIALAAGIIPNALAAAGEELGWRGYLWFELRDKGFWRASYAIGIIWGFWHAPIILMGYNYPSDPVAGVFMMTAMTTLLSPLLCWVRLRGGSVIASCIFHGTFNAIAPLALFLVAGGTSFLVGPTGLAALIVLAAVNLVIFSLERKSPGPGKA